MRPAEQGGLWESRRQSIEKATEQRSFLDKVTCSHQSHLLLQRRGDLRWPRVRSRVLPGTVSQAHTRVLGYVSQGLPFIHTSEPANSKIIHLVWYAGM